MNKYLNGLVVRKGDVLSARTWANKGIHFSPAFLPGIGRLSSMGINLLQEGETAHFELQPIPSPGISEIIVEVDGQVMRYRNGPTDMDAIQLARKYCSGAGGSNSSGVFQWNDGIR